MVIAALDSGPVWAMPEWAEQEIRDALPASWELVVLRSSASRDRREALPPEVLDTVRGAEIYFGMGIPRDAFVAATTGPTAALRWVHTGSAGVGSALFPEMRASPVILTNSAGVMGPPMAETALAMILYFARGLDLAVQGMGRHEWRKDAIYEASAGVRELSDATLGIVGLGGIGRELAMRARALGMRVLATRRRAAGVLEGVDLRLGEEGLRELLAESDFVAITVPATAETRGMIGAEQLALMKLSAVLVNVARGSIVDEPALIDALRTHRLRGAGLDVFATEPLPPDSPLWSLPNVLVLPHVSAVTPLYWRRETDLVLDNLRRYLEGRELRNVVDKEHGY